MWCQACQQDIPAISTAEGRYCCARCGGPAGRIEAAPAELPLGEIPDYGIDLTRCDAPPATPDALLASWKIDDELRQAESVLRINSNVCDETKSAGRLSHRFDPPEIDLRSLQQAQALTMARESRRPVQSAVRGSSLAWTVLSFGLMTLVCGGVLLGWSIIAHRDALWNVGLPIAIGGQCALVIGLLLQLERLWQSGRYSQEKLAEVDQRLADLNTQTAMLSTTHSTASRAFYSHMSEGASPHVLLADVKGQLDLLTLRLGAERR
ncbi:MAG: hypothetical protein KDA42_12300 [Planctomycetales bacterium]|nr:hypothetical protein [Planctomycetales bacterium]